MRHADGKLRIRRAAGKGGVFLFLAGSQVVKADHAQIVPFALHAQLVQAVGGGSSDHVNVHAASQYTAMLVVGVVAANLGAAGGTIQTGFGVWAKGGLQPVQNSFIAGCLCRSFFGRAAVQCCQTGSVCAARKASASMRKFIFIMDNSSL